MSPYIRYVIFRHATTPCHVSLIVVIIYSSYSSCHASRLPSPSLFLVSSSFFAAAFPHFILFSSFFFFAGTLHTTAHHLFHTYCHREQNRYWWHTEGGAEGRHHLPTYQPMSERRKYNIMFRSSLMVVTPTMIVGGDMNVASTPNGQYRHRLLHHTVSHVWHARRRRL